MAFIVVSTLQKGEQNTFITWEILASSLMTGWLKSIKTAQTNQRKAEKIQNPTQTWSEQKVFTPLQLSNFVPPSVEAPPFGMSRSDMQPYCSFFLTISAGMMVFFVVVVANIGFKLYKLHIFLSDFLNLPSIRYLLSFFWSPPRVRGHRLR